MILLIVSLCLSVVVNIVLASVLIKKFKRERISKLSVYGRHILY